MFNEAQISKTLTHENNSFVIQFYSSLFQGEISGRDFFKYFEECMSAFLKGGEVLLFY